MFTLTTANVLEPEFASFQIGLYPESEFVLSDMFVWRAIVVGKFETAFVYCPAAQLVQEVAPVLA